MPIYEYECNKCKYRFEKLQSFSAAPLKKCPRCSGPVHKVLHVPGILFKGGGFFTTDRKDKPSFTPGKPKEEKNEPQDDKGSVADN